MGRDAGGRRRVQIAFLALTAGLAFSPVEAASPGGTNLTPLAAARPIPQPSGASGRVSTGSPTPTSMPAPTAFPGFGGLTLGGDQPIEIAAGELDLEHSKGRVVYRGGVDVRQGDLHLVCDQLTITYQGGDAGGATELEEVVAHGHVRVEQGARSAVADLAIFDSVERKISLLGAAEVRDGPNIVRGDRVTIFVDEGRSVVEAARDQRVTAVLHPGSTRSGSGLEEKPLPATGGAGVAVRDVVGVLP